MHFIIHLLVLEFLVKPLGEQESRESRESSWRDFNESV